MADRKKFSEMKNAFASLSKMMADYEQGFGEEESGDCNEFSDDSAHNGGQAPSPMLEPEVDSGSEGEDTDGIYAGKGLDTKDPGQKKKSMKIMASVLRSKVKAKGY